MSENYTPPSVSYEGVVDFGITGLAGTLTFAITDNLSAYVFGPTTAGITEFPVGTGIYQITFTAPAIEGQYTMVWEDGTGNVAIDSLVVTSSAPIQVIGGPGSDLGPISGWITGADVAACCDVDYGTDSSVFDQVAQSAQSLLFQLSARLFPGFGVETSARPCRTSCACPWQVLSRGHIVWRDDPYGWYGWGGDWWGGSDWPGCRPYSEVKLSGYPIVAITQVKINGVVIDPITYRVERDRYLIRQMDPADPNTVLRWPSCQNMDLPDTEEGTFSVSYTFGQNPPQLGIDAAAQLACEFYKQCNGQECRLPQGTTRVARQGLVIEKEAFYSWGFEKGGRSIPRGWRTSIPLVDAFLNAYNNSGILRRPTFWSPSPTHRYAKLRS